MTPYNPFKGQTIKSDAGIPVDRAFLAHYSIPAADADAASTTFIEAATVLADGATTKKLKAALDAQPPTPRVLSVTGNQATVAGNVVIKGKDFAGADLEETIVAAGVATVLGTKAFAEITEIEYPARVAAADSIAVGISDKFGIPFKLPNIGSVIQILNNGAVTTAAATSGFSATVLADNFIDPTAALAGNQVDVYLLV